MLLDAFMAASPLLAIFVFILLLNKPADVAGLLALLVGVLVSCLYFQTDLRVALLSTLAGLIASLPISLTFGIGVLLILVMSETGAIERVSVQVKTMAVGDRPTQVLLHACAFSAALASLGAMPIAVLPPLMLSLGYTIRQAIALPNIGMSAMCPFGLLSMPLLIFVSFCGISLDEAGYLFMKVVPLVTWSSAVLSLWVVGGKKLAREGFAHTLFLGVATWAGVYLSARFSIMPVAGVVVSILMAGGLLGLSALRGRRAFDRSVLAEKDLAMEKRLSLLAAVSPWLALTTFAVLINMPQLPLHGLVNALPMNVEILPGEKIPLRVFSQTYFWVLFSFLLCYRLLKPAPGTMLSCVRKGLPRAGRAALAAGVYFCIAYVLNHSGKNANWQLISHDNNMILVLAKAAAESFGVFYVAAASYIGLASGVLTGSVTASVATFTTLHMRTAELIHVSGPLVAMVSAMGAGIASFISPAKLLAAAANINRIGEEGPLLRMLIIPALAMTLLIAIVAFAL